MSYGDDYLITVTGALRDEGSLVLLSGLTEDNRQVVFAAERRYAIDIMEAVAAGDEPVASVPSYMVTSMEAPYKACINVTHNEVDCHRAGLSLAEWCDNCKA